MICRRYDTTEDLVVPYYTGDTVPPKILQRRAILTNFLGLFSVAQLVKTMDAAVLGDVAVFVRACMA